MPNPEPLTTQPTSSEPPREPAPKRRVSFRWRAFTSVLLTITGVLLVLSGMVLFFAPRGSVARATGFGFLGLDRWEWAALHVDIMWVFLTATILHVVLNGRALWGYLKQRSRTPSAVRIELFIAVVVTTIFLCLSLGNVWPFGTEGRGRQGPMWRHPGRRGGGGHHRGLSGPGAQRRLAEVAARFGLSRQQAVAALRRAGYRVPDNATTVGEVAQKSGVRPRDIMAALRRRAW